MHWFLNDVCHKYLVTTFSRYYIDKISTNISDIAIFLLLNTHIGIGPRNPSFVSTVDWYSMIAVFICHSSAINFLSFHYRQSGVWRDRTCHTVWLHWALGVHECHPEEGPDWALCHGLWLQGKFEGYSEVKCGVRVTHKLKRNLEAS